MTFAWDPKKASANFKKHGVDFREAATVFDDPLSATFHDEEHSSLERRFVTIGMSVLGGLLVVVHADVGEAIRIISAREATRAEQKFYEEN